MGTLCLIHFWLDRWNHQGGFKSVSVASRWVLTAKNIGNWDLLASFWYHSSSMNSMNQEPLSGIGMNHRSSFARWLSCNVDGRQLVFSRFFGVFDCWSNLRWSPNSRACWVLTSIFSILAELIYIGPGKPHIIRFPMTSWLLKLRLHKIQNVLRSSKLRAKMFCAVILLLCRIQQPKNRRRKEVAETEERKKERKTERKRERGKNRVRKEEKQERQQKPGEEAISKEYRSGGRVEVNNRRRKKNVKAEEQREHYFKKTEKSRRRARNNCYSKSAKFQSKNLPAPHPMVHNRQAHRCQCRFHPTWRRHIFFRVFEWEKDVRFEPALQMWLEVVWVHKWSFKVVSFHPICRGWMGPLWNVAGIHEKSSKNGTWANWSWIRTHFWFKSLLHNN